MKTIDVWRIVTLFEAAKRTHMDPRTLRKYAERHDDFPKPFLVFSKNFKLYDYLAISKWLSENAPYGFKTISEQHRERLREAARETFLRRRGLVASSPEEVPDNGPNHKENTADQDGNEDARFLPGTQGLREPLVGEAMPPVREEVGH